MIELPHHHQWGIHVTCAQLKGGGYLMSTLISPGSCTARTQWDKSMMSYQMIRSAMTILNSLIKETTGLHLLQEEATESAYEFPISWDARVWFVSYIWWAVYIFYKTKSYITQRFMYLDNDICRSTWNASKLWIYHVLASDSLDKGRQSQH